MKKVETVLQNEKIFDEENFQKSYDKQTKEIDDILGSF